MLFVVLPLTDILCAIRVCIGAFAVSFIVQPIPLIDISIGMVQLSVTICFSELPLAFIKRAVRPPLFPHSISETVKPFSLVNRFRLKSYRTSNLPYS